MWFDPECFFFLVDAQNPLVDESVADESPINESSEDESPINESPDSAVDEYSEPLFVNLTIKW